MKEGYRLAARLRDLAGVFEARFNPDNDRMIQVFFDPNETNGRRFIEVVSAAGRAATLIAG